MTDEDKTEEAWEFERADSSLQMALNYLRMAVSDAAGGEAGTHILGTIIRAISEVEMARAMLTAPSPPFPMPSLPGDYRQQVGGLGGGAQWPR